METDTETLLQTIGEQTVQLRILRREGQLAAARNTVYENALREAGIEPGDVIAEASDAAMRMAMGQLPSPPEPPQEPEPEPAEAGVNGKG